MWQCKVCSYVLKLTLSLHLCSKRFQKQENYRKWSTCRAIKGKQWSMTSSVTWSLILGRAFVHRHTSSQWCVTLSLPVHEHWAWFTKDELRLTQGVSSAFTLYHQQNNPCLFKHPCWNTCPFTWVNYLLWPRHIFISMWVIRVCHYYY